MAQTVKTAAGTCPECGTPVGGASGTDVYKHTIQCFHLPDQGVARLLAEHEGKNDDRSKRITAALSAARGEE